MRYSCTGGAGRRHPHAGQDGAPRDCCRGLRLLGTPEGKISWPTGIPPIQFTMPTGKLATKFDTERWDLPTSCLLGEHPHAGQDEAPRDRCRGLRLLGTPEGRHSKLNRADFYGPTDFSFAA